MAEVTFYHQERIDGGRRSGLTVDGTTVLHGFVPSEADRDPALAWYVDVKLKATVPPNSVTALDWLKTFGKEIRTALAEASEQLACGIDVDTMPWEYSIPGEQGPIGISVSAMRRLTAKNIGAELKRLSARKWTTLFPDSAPIAEKAR